MKICLLLFMLFCHLVDDYYLQGILAQMKQKAWWVNQLKNIPETKTKMYMKDYVIALLEHAFSWTFMIQLPIMIYLLWQSQFDIKAGLFIGVFIVNWCIHTFVDDLKANKLKINLVQDQLIHICQVVITWVVFFVI